MSSVRNFLYKKIILDKKNHVIASMSDGISKMLISCQLGALEFMHIERCDRILEVMF